jgi:hypothetical protein
MSRILDIRSPRCDADGPTNSPVVRRDWELLIAIRSRDYQNIVFNIENYFSDPRTTIKAKSVTSHLDL